jgi:membrane protein EpsK
MKYSEAGNEKQRFFYNVFANVAYIFTQTAAILWLTPFLINYLGIAAFGIIFLANAIVAYMSIFTTALHSAVSRFLTIDIKMKDIVKANKTFNTAFFGLCSGFLVFSPLIVIAAFVFPMVFDVPTGWENDARSLFVILSFAFFVTVVGSIFSVSAFSQSRFVLINGANFFGLLARIGIVLLLYSLFPARIWYAGAGVFAAALLTACGHIFIWRRLTPELSIQIKSFDRARLQAMTGMGGWLVVNMVGAMLLSRVDLIVINTFYGAAMTGGYASVAQFSFLLEYLVNAAATVVRPVILAKYAQQDFEGLRLLAAQVVKLLGLILALPVGLLCGFSRPLLAIWLGPSFEHLSIVLIIIVGHQSLNLAIRPLLDVQNAFNKVRWPGIMTLISGIFALGLAICLAMWTRWEAVGVAVAVAIAWSAKNIIYMPIYTASIMGQPWWRFLPSLGPALLSTGFVGLISYGLIHVHMPAGWFSLGALAFLASLIYICMIWMFAFNRDDRQLVKGLFPLKEMRSQLAFITR